MNSIKKFSWFNADGGLLVLRIGVGAIFILTGVMKVSHMSQTIGFFATLGFSAFWAYLVAGVELIGGIAVLLGIMTRIFATLLVVTMIVAIWVTRTDITVMMTPLSMFFSSLALLLAGPGKYAVVREKAALSPNAAPVQ